MDKVTMNLNRVGTFCIKIYIKQLIIFNQPLWTKFLSLRIIRGYFEKDLKIKVFTKKQSNFKFKEN